MRIAFAFVAVVSCITAIAAQNTASSSGFSCTTAVPPKYAGATTIFAWGANWYGQLSSPKDIEPRPYPLLVGSASMNVSKITGGFMHNAVLDAAGNQAWLAGLAESGQMGGGPTVNTKQTQYLPVPFIVDDVDPELFTRAVHDIAGGYQHTCLITQRFNWTTPQGVVYCSGNNDKGQLGRSDIESVTYILPVTATDPMFTAASITALASGPDNMVALTSTGELWSWGANSNGELGNGQTTDANQPVRVHNMRNIVKIGCGFGFCAALDASGILYGWGKNDRFQLGGASTEKAVTIPVQILADVSDFSCGGAHMLAVVENRLYSWGEGTLGATGHPKNIPSLVLDRWYVRTPTAVADFANVNIRSIAAGGKHSIVLDTCGVVYTFGSDSLGQLGQEKLTAKRYQFRSLVAKTNANIKRRGVKPVAVYASWFNSFVVTEETAL